MRGRRDNPAQRFQRNGFDQATPRLCLSKNGFPGPKKTQPKTQPAIQQGSSRIQLKIQLEVSAPNRGLTQNLHSSQFGTQPGLNLRSNLEIDT